MFLITQLDTLYNLIPLLELIIENPSIILPLTLLILIAGLSLLIGFITTDLETALKYNDLLTTIFSV